MKQKKNKAKTIDKNTIRMILSSLTISLGISSFFLLNGYNSGVYKNASLIFPETLKLPILLYAFTAIIISIFAVLYFKNNRFKILFLTLLLSISAGVYFGNLQSLKPTLTAIFIYLPNVWWLVALAYLLFIVTISILLVNYLYKRTSIEKHNNIEKNVSSVFIVIGLYLMFVNIYPALKYSISIDSQIKYMPNKLITDNNNVTDKPNVYYIVLDRYTNDANLKKYFNYDNSQFTNYLESKGFTIDLNAVSNYPYTASSIGSTMSADYLNDLEEKFKDGPDSELPLFQKTRYSPVADKFKELGYDYNVVGSWYSTSNSAPMANNFYYEYSTINAFGVKHNLQEYETTIVKESLFGEYLINSSILKLQNPVSLTQYQLDSLDDIVESNVTNSPSFTFAHILVPHEPFVFNADGSINNMSTDYDNIGKTVSNKYLDQIKYINTEMKNLIENITSSDPDAVIILQADEGFYPHLFFGNSSLNNKIKSGDYNMEDWDTDYLKAKYGVLAAYRLPKPNEGTSTVGTDSVNIFRYIFNEYFDAGMTYLPNCQFGLPKGIINALDYTDITDKLSSNPDPGCTGFHDK